MAVATGAAILGAAVLQAAVTAGMAARQQHMAAKAQDSARAAARKQAALGRANTPSEAHMADVGDATEVRDKGVASTVLTQGGGAAAGAGADKLG